MTILAFNASKEEGFIFSDNFCLILHRSHERAKQSIGDGVGVCLRGYFVCGGVGLSVFIHVMKFL